MTAGLEQAESARPLVEKLEIDPQLSSDVVADPARVDTLTALRETRDKLLRQYRQKVLEFITDLDLDVDMDAIRERLEKVTLVLAEKESPHFQEKEQESPEGYAFYEPRDLSITVAVEDGQVTEHGHDSIVHELLHVASGSLYIARDNKGSLEIEPIATGLAKHRRLRRFNEAVTVHLTERILGEQAHTSSFYKPDLELFEEILRVSGIPEKVFLEAYFEAPDLNANPGKRMPKWHQMQTALNDKFGPDFLRRLYDVRIDDSSQLSGIRDGTYSTEEFARLRKLKYGEEFLEAMHEDSNKLVAQTATGGLFRRFSKKKELEKIRQMRQKWNIVEREKDSLIK